MAVDLYQRLVEDIRQLTLLPRSAISYELTHLSVREINFSLQPVVDTDEGHLLIHCDLGPLPVQRREEALLRLLKINLHLLTPPRVSSFSCNEQSERIVLSVSQPLPGLTAGAVLDQMGWLADHALAWRVNAFLDDTPSKPDRSLMDDASARMGKSTLKQRAL